MLTNGNLNNKKKGGNGTESSNKVQLLVKNKPLLIEPVRYDNFTKRESEKSRTCPALATRHNKFKVINKIAKQVILFETM